VHGRRADIGKSTLAIPALREYNLLKFWKEKRNMEFGKKIKYCRSIYCGKEIIETAYVLQDDGGDYIWISSTKESLKDGLGHTILRSELR
jgi:hypothetical protein